MAYLQNNWQQRLRLRIRYAHLGGPIYFSAPFLFKWQETDRLRFAVLAGDLFLASLETDFLPIFLSLRPGIYARSPPPNKP